MCDFNYIAIDSNHLINLDSVSDFRIQPSCLHLHHPVMLGLSILLTVATGLILCTEFVGVAPVNASSNLSMKTNLPKFSLPWARLHVPTLEAVSRAIAKSTRKKIYEFANNYACILMRHFSCETEIQIVDGCFTQDSESILSLLESEMEVLQYKERLGDIMGPWQTMLCGQPVQPEIQNVLNNYVESIILDFEGFISELQVIASKDRRSSDNLLCKQVCSSKSRILNLTETNIPAELEKALTNGSKFVPLDSLNCDDLKSLIEKDLISAAVNFFREHNTIYPLVNIAAGLKTVLEQLISQSPSNSCQIEFYTTMYNYYVNHKSEFYDKLSEDHFVDNPSIQNLLPAGTILAKADK